MADVKISALPEATSISSTDVAPVVTGGITKKASAATIVKAVLPAPGAIGSTTPDTGVFTTLGIGATPVAGQASVNGAQITGATASYANVTNGTVQSGVAVAHGYATSISTAASAFTLNNLIHFRAIQSTIGVGSAVNIQQGFYADSSLTGATNNYGFFGNLAAGTGRYNLYMAGTADNYLAGKLGIGATPTAGQNVAMAKDITGAATSWGYVSYPTVQSDVTSNAGVYYSQPSVVNAVFTLDNLYHFNATQGSVGASSTINNQYGFFSGSSITGATNNYGFYGSIAAGTGRWNLYMGGSADNYLAGSLGLGILPASGNKLHVLGTIYTDANTSTTPLILDSAANLDSSRGIAFNIAGTNYGRILIAAGSGGAMAFWTGSAGAAVERMRIDSTGNVLVTGTGGLGYGTGSGGAITQTVSRTSGVTLNKTNGAITLVSAAGSATYQSFTVTNSTVAATDTIIINQKSGTDLYEIFITAVAAGSFRVTYRTTGGTTTEQPVVNFSVIKAVTA